MKYPAHAKLMTAVIEAQGLTQGQMARKMGWASSQFVSNIVRGHARIPPSKFKRFSTLSGISVEELLESYLSYEREQIIKKQRLKC